MYEYDADAFEPDEFDAEAGAPICLFCGQPEFTDVLEIWPETREFQLETCCEGLHEAWVEAVNCPVTGDEALQELTELVGGYYPVRKVYDSESRQQIVLDFGLELREISQAEAKAFVAKHHRHNKPPRGDRWRHAVYNGSDLIAVAHVGRPVARMIDGTTTVEVTRLCVNHDLDRELTWKACSMLYLAAFEEAKRRGYQKVITYTLETEEGTTLRYARFKPKAKTKGGSWNTPSRPREDQAPTCRKIRWERLTGVEGVAAA